MLESRIKRFSSPLLESDMNEFIREIEAEIEIRDIQVRALPSFQVIGKNKIECHDFYVIIFGYKKGGI